MKVLISNSALWQTDKLCKFQIAFLIYPKIRAYYKKTYFIIKA